MSGSVRVAMELLVRRFADARARRVGLADQRVEAFAGERRRRIERDLLERALDVGQLRLQAGQRLAEETERLEEPHDVRADPARRTEVDDLHRDAPADAIEPADPLFDDRRFPRQVEQHQAAAELEVATLASAFRGHEQAWTIGLAEPGDFGVAARRGQLLVEDAGRELRPVAERRAQHLQRLAVRHEDERLLPRVSPARRLRQQPVEARVAGVHRLRLLAQRAFVGSEHGSERRSRRQRAADAIDLLPPRDRVRRRRASHAPPRPRACSCQLAAMCRARSECRPAAAGLRCRRGAWSWCTEAEACRSARRASKLTSSGNSSRTQELEQPEEPVGVVFERGRAQEQHVTTQARDRRDRAPAGVARVARRTAESLRFVHDQQVDSRAHRLVGQLRALDQHLQRDHGATMHVERVEVGDRSRAPRRRGAARRGA